MVGSVRAVLPVAVNVVEKAPTVPNVLPSARLRVAEVVGAVIVNLLIEVAVATPSTGVTKVGLVAKTREPEPVSSLIAVAN